MRYAIILLMLGCTSVFDGAVPIDGKPLSAVGYLHTIWNMSNELKPIPDSCSPGGMSILLVGDDGINKLCPPYCAPGTPVSDECPLGNASGCYIDANQTAVVHMNFDITQIAVHEAAHRAMACSGYPYSQNLEHSNAAIWASGGVVSRAQEAFK